MEGKTLYFDTNSFKGSGDSLEDVLRVRDDIINWDEIRDRFHAQTELSYDETEKIFLFFKEQVSSYWPILHIKMTS